ncbi:lantibiotic dehydratase [Chitinophaga flava]|uniref:Lantibiotic dehydratase n=1 Tax=Chitinophaga flava TaxID=2259036 RepID=A0A365Y1V0_9BACT|nr:lantibiotic dehydratase [Chitinophaga flava]RBL92480.1 hypothetical protein DF182_07825 [Chitinophaga flava]
MSELVPLNFYLLRLPLLPLGKPVQLPEEHIAFATAIATIYENPLLQEAIYLASPALHQEMMKWLRSPAQSDTRHQKLILALYRYLLRMSVRATPYGLFAGCATGTVTAAPSRLEVTPIRVMQKITRLDMGYLSEIATALTKDPETRQKIRFFPNNSLYLSGESYRYFEYQQRDKRRRYFLSGFTCTPYIAAVVVAAAKGARLSELVNVLTEQGIPEAEATKFLHLLIDNQILTAETDPVVTDSDYLSRMIGLLQECPEPPAIVEPLQAIQRLLHYQQHGIQRYQQIREIVQACFPTIDGKDLIQSDLFFKPAANTLNATTVKQLVSQCAELAVLTRPMECADLATFRQQFYQKFEEREIPLMQALDSESGIGYGLVSGDNSSYTPLIDDLIMPGQKNAGNIAWNYYYRFVMNKYLDTQRQGLTRIDITAEDLAALASENEQLVMPSSLFLMGALVADNAQALDTGDYSFILKSFTGPQTWSLLGRFAAGNDSLAQQLREQVQQEQYNNPDRIIAEVVHLPEGRTGNVLLRPRLYDYEIPFLANASVDQDFQIAVSDLYVSVRNNRVVLRSRRLGKEILPRLTSAHNFEQGLPAYKFLCDLQHQEHARGFMWDWGLLGEQPFLPSVHYGNIVLSRARWYLTSKEFQSLQSRNSPAEALLAMWKKYHVPDQVLLAEGDNELLIDIRNPYGQQLAVEKLKKGNIELLEYYFGPASGLVVGEEGAYTNEVIIPVLNKSYVHQQVSPAPAVPERVQRVFPPGSEWLYAKIYCGPKWMDKLLVRELLPLMTELREKGLIQQWFFLRYQDPDHHLRIRLLQTPASAGSNVLTERLRELIQPYIENDVVKKLQYDTYVRELERYGEQTMALSETLFFYDSETAARLLTFIPRNETNDRWLLTLKGVDDLLSAFGLKDTEKLDLCRQLYNGFFTEFNGNDTLLLQLNNKYRRHMRLIADLLQQSPQQAVWPPQVTAVFEERASRLAGIRWQLHSMAADGTIPENMYLELLPHYIHMFMNRMFIANARMHELVVHHFLMKYYTSRVAQHARQMS